MHFYNVLHNPAADLPLALSWGDVTLLIVEWKMFASNIFHAAFVHGCLAKIKCHAKQSKTDTNFRSETAKRKRKSQKQCLVAQKCTAKYAG